MLNFKYIISLACLLSIVTYSKVSLAVRPFITDDAYIGSHHGLQLESWAQVNKLGFQHWAIFSAASSQLETSIGLMYGKHNGEPEVEAPLLQLKFLGLPTNPGAILPGVAMSIGIFPRKDSTEIFQYLALSESLDKDNHILLHQNVGLSSSYSANQNINKLIWGAGSQIYLARHIYFINEVFSGDPYVGQSSIAFQLGGRYFVSPLMQLDATMGRTIDSDPNYNWFTIGCRLSTKEGLY